jgi:fructose-bisphosphate aldolase, class I
VNVSLWKRSRYFVYTETTSKIGSDAGFAKNRFLKLFRYKFLFLSGKVVFNKTHGGTIVDLKDIEKALGSKAESLLKHTCKTVSKERLHIPDAHWVERIFAPTDRNIRVLRNLEALFSHGRLANTGYLSILPVDQGIEHSAGASFAPNPDYFDSENIVKLAIEGGCNAVASSFGVLGSVARKYAHKIPFLVKFNHNELLSYPNTHDQIFFGTIEEAYNMGAAAVGATIYFGSPESHHQIIDVSRAFAYAHELGMATVLWCYTRNSAFKTAEDDYHTAADLTGQANHLGATIQADIVKQKLPTTNGGFKVLKFGKQTEAMYSKLSSDHPIDLTRYQVLNGYSGRIGLINSGGPSGKNDLQEAIETAVINKRAGGMGLISGRKAFQRPMKEGVELLHAIQDVYRCKEITIA